MRIVLIGFMGSGKSSLASLLAEALDYDCFEMDDHIRSSAGVENIQHIFDQYGEAHFRQLESEAADAAAALDNVVVSTGGGVIGRKDNMRALKSGEARVIYLQTSFAEAKRRLAQLAEDEDRPLFSEEAEAERLLAERDPLYKQSADLTLNTDEKSLPQVRDAVLEWLNTE